MGLFSTLSIGTRGLFAAQLGMDVAGQNVSNADVAGYSRKRLNMTADYRADGQYGQMGFGVDVINIDRMRDKMIDQQIQRQNQQVGSYQEYDYTLQQIENIFNEPGSTGLASFVDKFFDSWQNLANNPADISARTMVKTSADIMVDVFHNLSGELSNLKAATNEKLRANADSVNELTKEIFNLNIEIGSVEINNQKANDSRDKRDGLLKELSSLVDIDTQENSQGQISVTSNGNLLVSPVGSRDIEITTTTFTMPDGTQASNIGLRFKDSQKNYNPTSGAINGLFGCRDTIIPEYEEKLNTIAKALMTSVNNLHQRGYNLMGYTGLDFFNPNATGASDIALSESISSDVQNISAATGNQAYAAPANVFGAGALNFGVAPTFLSKTNVLPAAGADVARNVIKNSVRMVGTQPLTGLTATLVENVDYRIDYAHGTVQMLHAGYDGWQMNVDFQYRSGGFKGPGDNTNAVAIAQLRQGLTMQPDALGNPTNTYVQYYSAFIGHLGLARQEATSNLETRTFLVNQYEKHQDSISGVSIDEEMADIIKFQHSYQAAARVISTASQMLDYLLNMAS